MSTSCLFHLQVWPSTGATSEPLHHAFTRFVDGIGLAAELQVVRVEQDGVVVLRATSPWALGISGASEWVPRTEAELRSAMRAVDPACEVSFRVRYPDEEAEQDFFAELETDDSDASGDRQVDVFFSYDRGELSTANDTIQIPASNVRRLAWRLFTEGDFFGVVGDEGTTLQAMLEKNGRVWLEVPVPKERGSYGKYVRREELDALVNALPTRLEPTIVEGLRFTAFGK